MKQTKRKRQSKTTVKVKASIPNDEGRTSFEGSFLDAGNTPVRVKVREVRWPREMLVVLIPWIHAQSGIHGSYVYTLLGNRDYSYHGTGWRHAQETWLPRRFRRSFPYIWKDSRIPHASPHEMRSNVEMLVYLIAHECIHATTGHPDKWMKRGRENKVSMEFHCNSRAMDILRQYRKERAKIWARIAKRLRAKRRREQRVEQQRIEREAARDPREEVIADLSKKIEAWEQRLVQANAKVKRAKTALAKYRRSLSQHRRLAAKENK